jgi:hypothetical protein
MAVVAPLSTYRKNSFKLYIAVSVLIAGLCVYDGYFSSSFAKDHTVDGKADKTLKANQAGPFVFLPLAALLAVRWWMVKDKKVVADGKTLILDDGEKIDYARIEKLDKANFEKKGFFVITYKDSSGKDVDRKISDKHWDNLSEVLVELVAVLKGDVAS